jgi:hypothetical protein
MLPAHEEFLAAANVLIRLYTERFGDSFVVTTSIDHLAAISPMHSPAPRPSWRQRRSR